MCHRVVSRATRAPAASLLLQHVRYGVVRVVHCGACSRVKADTTFFPGVKVCLGAEIVHGDENVITDLAKKQNWEMSQNFIWAHGDGGPSKTVAPNGAAGYYYIGGLKK